MRKHLSKILGLFLAVMFLAALFPAESDAAVSITIRNNRSHDMSFAFRWSGFDSPQDRRAGWYVVRAGQSRTLTFNSAVYALTSTDFGYYATGGGSVWRGTAENGLPVTIHPRNAFEGHPNGRIEGGQRVFFRRINLTEVGDRREDGRATLTFNP